MKYLLPVLSMMLSSYALMAQPGIAWQKSYGGSSNDFAKSIVQTNDGGYIVIGHTLSNDGDLPDNNEGQKLWVLKINVLGGIEWQKLLGETGADYFALSIQQTTDGGYILLSEKAEGNGPFYDDFDIWVVKLGLAGTLEWENTISGIIWDRGGEVRQTSDGGYILTTSSAKDQSPGGAYNYNFLVVKLNAQGEISWQKYYGGSSLDKPFAIRQIKDGGYIIAGETSSKDGDITGTFHGLYDYWVVRLNAAGDILWEKTFGGTDDEAATTVQQTSDGGFIVGGTSNSTDGDVLINHGTYDGWVLKLDSTGVIQWQKSLGSTNQEVIRDVLQRNDGSFIVAGKTSSFTGDFEDNHGFADWWVAKLDTSGEQQWLKTFGGSGEDSFCSIEPTQDGGFILSGESESLDGDVTENKGLYDYWIVKLSPFSVSANEAAGYARDLQIFPNPALQSITISIAEEESLQSVRITDLLGREMLSLNAQNNSTVDVSALPNGLYIVSATTTRGSVFLQKLMKRG